MSKLPYNKLGDTVYLKTDKDQLPRIVTGIMMRLTGSVYELSQGINTSHHYDFEFTSEINVLLKTEG